jgi:hypothetical protein
VRRLDAALVRGGLTPLFLAHKTPLLDQNTGAASDEFSALKSILLNAVAESGVKPPHSKKSNPHSVNLF